MTTLKFCTSAALLSSIFLGVMYGDPVQVRRVQGYLNGFIVLKGVDDKILASGAVTQIPAGNRITTTLNLHFKDGSQHQEVAVFSQRRVFQLLTFKQVQKGPSFPTQSTLFFDTASGKVDIQYTDKDGKSDTIAEKLTLPPDLANGLVPMLLTQVDPKVETTLSMLVSTPKPRIVKLKIASTEQDSFSVGGAGAKANHYVIKIDIGGLTGAVAKVAGKQPPPIHVWVAAGNAPVFLKSEGPLFEDGPIWKIEQASPSWPKSSPQP